jgi:hypothetical protein
MRLSVRAVLTCALAVVLGCAAQRATGSGDAGSATAVCPDHPERCDGKCCGASCVAVQSDNDNCGDCGNACGASLICLGGGCRCSSDGKTGVVCGSGQSCCGTNGCRSLMSDINNCGMCNHGCASGERCSGGRCVPPDGGARDLSGVD